MIKEKHERTVYIILLFILCSISFGLGFYLFKITNHTKIKNIPITHNVTINTKPIEIQDSIVKESFVGYVEAINTVNIKPYINGYISNVYAKAGDNTSVGDILVAIDSGEYKAKLNAAKATVYQTLAKFEYDNSYYERVKNSKKNTFSEIQIIEAKNNYLQSKASYENALAEEDFAQFNYNQTIIKSSINGKISNFTLSIGDYISPTGNDLFTITQLDPIRVVFSLTDTQYLNSTKDNKPLFKNSVIKLKLANGEVFKHTGEFKYTDNKISKNTNSLAVYTYFENNEHKLLPNSYVTVEVYTTIKNTVQINKNLVSITPKGYFVNIERDNKIKTLSIEILSEEKGNYIIKNCFDKNDYIIIDNISNINTNDKVDFITHK